MPTPVGKTALKRAIVLAVALVGVVGLTFAGSWIFRDVRQQVSLLAGANSDAAQWTLAQGDVELLAFLVEARSAQMGEATLRDVRRVMPSDAEVAANPRARSAVMRVAERTDAAWEAQP